MKIRNLLYAAAALVFAAVACQEKEPQKEETPAPEIQIQKTEVTLASDGASVNVAYLIENEVEGRKISVANDAEWLTVDTGKARVITLSALINETGAQRHTDVTISYEGAEDVVCVGVDFGNRLRLWVVEKNEWHPAVFGHEFDDGLVAGDERGLGRLLHDLAVRIHVFDVSVEVEFDVKRVAVFGDCFL